MILTTGLSLHGIETILANPFYTGIINIKRTGQTYKGVHEVIISPRLFQRVQDIKSGRCGPKLTRHNHLFQGLFRCGLCSRPMSPERQKGTVYYRCQQKGCPTKTIREDVLDSYIMKALEQFQLSNIDAQKLALKWNSCVNGIKQDDIKQSLHLRITATKQALNRAADLLIEGTLDNDTYLAKKQEAHLVLSELQEELGNLPNPQEIQCDNEQFIELLKNLAGLYANMNPAEKKIMVENTFSNRIIIGRQPIVEPYSWVTEAHNYEYVSFGDPHRHKDRTFMASKELKRVCKLFLKNKWPDDLRIAA